MIGAQHHLPKRCQTMFQNWFSSEFHESADCRRCRVQLIYLVFVNNLPVSIVIRIEWSTFEHHWSGTICQRSIDDVRVSSDPANIGCAPINVSGLVVEHHFKCRGCVYQVASCRVKNAFRFARRSTSVEHEERIFSCHPLHGEFSIHFF